MEFELGRLMGFSGYLSQMGYWLSYLLATPVTVLWSAMFFSLLVSSPTPSVLPDLTLLTSRGAAACFSKGIEWHLNWRRTAIEYAGERRIYRRQDLSQFLESLLALFRRTDFHSRSDSRLSFPVYFLSFPDVQFKYWKAGMFSVGTFSLRFSVLQCFWSRAVTR